MSIPSFARFFGQMEGEGDGDGCRVGSRLNCAIPIQKGSRGSGEQIREQLDSQRGEIAEDKR
jgi:hypothetical protein